MKKGGKQSNAQETSMIRMLEAGSDDDDIALFQLANKLIRDNTKEKIPPSKKYQLFASNEVGCMHGYEAPEDHQIDTILVPALEAIYACETNDEYTGSALNDAQNALITNFPSTFNDASVLRLLSRRLLCIGTNLLLDCPSEIDGKPTNFLYLSNVILSLSEFICQHQEVQLLCSKPSFYLHKIRDLLHSDERRMVSYARKRIPCSCLDARFSTLKEFPKMSVCDNISGSCNRGRIELDKLLSCERCRKVHYCSKACQAADFGRHKEECIEWMKWKKDNMSAGLGC